MTAENEPGWYDRGGLIPGGSDDVRLHPGERLINLDEAIRHGREYIERMYGKPDEEEDVT